MLGAFFFAKIFNNYMQLPYITIDKTLIFLYSPSVANSHIYVLFPQTIKEVAMITR